MGVVVYLQLLETASAQDVAEQLQYPARGKCRRNEREIKKKRQWPLLFCTNPNLNSPCSSTNTIEELQDIQEIQGKEIIVLLADIFGMNPNLNVFALTLLSNQSMFFILFFSERDMGKREINNKTAHWQGLHINGQT